MSFTPMSVQFNTNPYAPGFQSTYVLTRNDLPTLPIYYSPAPTYIDFWYPRCAQFWKIPKGSKNIRFKIPHWYVGDTTYTENGVKKKLNWSSYYLSEGNTRYGEGSNWRRDPQKVLELANDVVDMINGMGYGLSLKKPDSDILYTMQDGTDFSGPVTRQGGGEVASFCHNCNASIQVFHTNGRLLTGTPLRNWNTARASYWNFGPAGHTIYPGAAGSNAPSYPTDDATEEAWLKEGLWVSWYTMVQSSKTGVYYFDAPTPALVPLAGTTVTPSMITSALQELYPSIFTSSFNFDDTVVNGTGLEVTKSNDYSLNYITVDNETIGWSGTGAGAIGSGAGDRMAYELKTWHSMLSYTPAYMNADCIINPTELLEISVATEDLIIGVITNDYVGIVGSWDQYEEDPPEPDLGPYMRELTPCPATLRYHPIHKYQAPYGLTTISCTDRLHKKIALYHPIRDHIGCIEIRRMGDGENTGGKRIYTDHSFWYKHSPNPVEVMDMSFGYDYQRLYVLYKQSIDANITLTDESILEKKHYRAWITMYDTGLPDGAVTDSRVSIPLYGFIRDDEHIHPFAPIGIENTLGYMNEIGLTSELLDKPELAPTFNILSAHDKLFATIPCLFHPVATPDGIGADVMRWKPKDARLLCQLLYMFDETYGTFGNVAIIGAISPWLEDWQTPFPDIEPKHPFKLRMSLVDETVLWTLADVRKHPKEYYDPDPTLDNYPGMLYYPNMWDGTGLPDRFWQPLTLEALTIDELINSMSSASQTYSRPITLKGKQFYVHNPVTTDMYTKSAVTWDGQRIFGTRDHFLYEDRIVYHNFRRKILTGIGPVSRIIPGEVKEDYPEQRFEVIDFSDPDSLDWVGDVTLFPYYQSCTLKPGYYTAYLRGADGAPAIDADDGSVYASGGQGATVRVDFELTKTLNLDVYVGNKGTSYEGGAMNGGNGGSYIQSEGESIWNTLYRMDQLFEKKESRYTPPIGGYGLFWTVPAGATNISVEIVNPCSAHNASIQTFHTDGTLLTGTKCSGRDNLWSWFHNDKTANASTTKATNRMKQIYSTLPSGFSIDDSQVNGGVGNPTYTPSMQTYEVDGETIKWTGNKVRGRAQNGRGTGEKLFIQKTEQEMIIGILATHWFSLRVSYDMPAKPVLTSGVGVIAGGGGGLTGIFLESTPLFVAGSGGGAGNPMTFTDEDNEQVFEANGGHGGSIYGGYGTLRTANFQPGGGQSSGYQLYIGQSALEQNCAGGGGGSGYYGGTAHQVPALQAPGGGGGSSYIIGADGYATHPKLEGLTVTGFVVEEGSTPPWANPQDGQVIITGYHIVPRTETITDYQFISHDLGDMYYQCATEAEEDMTPTFCGLNVIILNDCTTSMAELILTLADAMPALVTGVANSKYDAVQFAAVGYANDRITVDTTGGGGYFTQDESILTSRMTNISESVTYRFENYNLPDPPYDPNPNIPYGNGDYETWADAVVQSYNFLSSSFLQGNVMFVIITDDVNASDNPIYKTNQAKSICTGNKGSVTFVLPTTYSKPMTPEAQDIVDSTSGSFIKGMQVGSSDWGGTVAQQIVEAAPEPSWEYDLGFAHVFSIENLSCNTYMCDVNLTSTKNAIKLGYLPHCDPSKPFGMGGDAPNLRTLHWDEIPPHTEAFFIISYEAPRLTIPETTQFEGHSFRLVEESLTWEEAKTRCEELGGHLATLTSQNKQNFVAGLANKACWIGGFTKSGSNTDWEWVTGEDWDYTNFPSGQPDSPGGQEPYIQIGVGGNFNGGKWNNWTGSAKLPFVCEWDFDELPAPVSLTCDALQRGIQLEYYLEGRV